MACQFLLCIGLLSLKTFQTYFVVFCCIWQNFPGISERVCNTKWLRNNFLLGTNWKVIVWFYFCCSVLSLVYNQISFRIGTSTNTYWNLNGYQNESENSRGNSLIGYKMESHCLVLFVKVSSIPSFQCKRRVYWSKIWPFSSMLLTLHNLLYLLLLPASVVFSSCTKWGPNI